MASPAPRDEDRARRRGVTFHGTGAVAFSTKGEYGVRLMVQLGRHYGDRARGLAEIAAAEDMPRAYLEQLASCLRDAGLVVSHPRRPRRLRAGAAARGRSR